MNQDTEWDSNIDVDQLMSEYDDTFMPLPDIELEPHLLISKVRKHYMEYMIKILAANYEKSHRLGNKNIYLPSAIWKCAKYLEMKAAQTCMVVQIYRKCLVSVINEVKTDTKNGRLYKKLYETLHKEPQNEKRTQTKATGKNWQCQCADRKRRRKRCPTPKITPNVDETNRISFIQRVEELSVLLQKNQSNDLVKEKIPVVINMQTDPPVIDASVVDNQLLPDPKMTNNQPQTPNNAEQSDDLMLQLEKLFESDQDDDDLFTSAIIEDNNKKVPNGTQNSTQESVMGTLNGTHDSAPSKLNITQDSIIENHAAQIKSLDERLATLTGLLANNEPPPLVQQQKVVKKKQVNRWLCEEYFMKKNLFELLYQISDNNRKKLARIKDMYIHLFGDDSDDEEGIMSPNESPEFVASCKSRIDNWVMAILAPHYGKGHIQGKMLYKAVARHLIELIYKCKQYPSKHEVTSFVFDFLESRGEIRCEADFKEFRINNVPTYSSL